MTETQTPLLSVTVLNYNYARFLKECLESILSQTFTDFEVIVVDDCSKDESLKVIEPFLADPRIRLVSHAKNHGYIASLLEGSSSMSRGKYITVISADDVACRNDAFERQVALLESNPGVNFCFSSFAKLVEGQDQPEHHSFKNDRVVPGAELIRGILTNRQIAILHTGTMLRASAYRAVGGYASHLRYACDTDMWLRLSVEGDAGYVSDALYGYRIHASQMSGVGDFEGQMRETLGVIESGVERARTRHVIDAQVLRRGRRTFLFGAAIDEAFRGHAKVAIERCRVVFAMGPSDALVSREFWIVLLRVLLGRRPFDLLASVVGSPRSRTS